MLNIILEILALAVLAAIVLFFRRTDGNAALVRRTWNAFTYGFTLLLCGAALDLAGKTPWAPAFPLPDAPAMASGVASLLLLGGFLFILKGLRGLQPALEQFEELRQQLIETRRTMERKILVRTSHLEKKVEQHRKQDAALAIAEERSRMLYDHAPVSIAHGLINADFVERNQAFASMLGYESPDEMSRVGMEQGDLYHAWKDPEEARRLVERLKTEQTIRNVEACMVHKDGSDVWVRLNLTAMKDRTGNNYYFYSFADNITEEKLAVDALRDSETRLQAIMNSMPAGMYLVDHDNHGIVDVNPSALSMTGFSREELIGQPCCSRLCDEANKTCLAMRQGQLEMAMEGVLLRKDGTEFPIIKSVAGFSIDGHNYLLTTFVDISEQKRLEHLKEDVDRIVRHDLKSPIISVINAATLLLMNDDSVTDETRELLEIILQKGNKTLRMIGTSLLVYKMEAGTYDYLPEDVDFMEVIRRVIGELRDMAANKRVDITISFCGKPPGPDDQLPTLGNEMLYDSMASNLLKNAIEASPEGATVEINLGSREMPLFTIVNTGAVPEHIRSTFFDKYSTAGKSTGTGLGTYSARLIAQTVGGGIEMSTSDEDDRTTVTVHLPPTQY